MDRAPEDYDAYMMQRMMGGLALHRPPAGMGKFNERQEMMDTAGSSDWISDGYCDDKMSEAKERIQGRGFLRTGETPVVGQRADLKILMNREHAIDVILSGEVVEIEPMPTAPTLRPQESLEDKEGSVSLTTLFYPFFKQSAKVDPPVDSDVTILESLSVGTGVVFVTKEGWKKRIEETWGETQMEVLDVIIKMATEACPGAVQGQRVVCEGRLNFDHDMRRGSDDGPWSDGIPFDGRDVYRWTMVFNEHLVNKWTLDKESFVNLGRERRPRCWPWSNEDELPYERTGIDRLDRNKDGQKMYHVCIGPFGCTEIGHLRHYFGGALGSAIAQVF